MKIRKVIEYSSTEGDVVTAGVTHEVKVGRESSWVKYEIQHTLNESDAEYEANGGNAEEALMEHVNNKVMDFVRKTVESIRSNQ